MITLKPKRKKKTMVMMMHMQIDEFEKTYLAEQNDEARRRVGRTNQRGDQLQFSPQAKKRGMSHEVVKAFKRFEDFSPSAVDHDFGVFWVGADLFSFHIEYISIEGARMLRPEISDLFRRRFIISLADEVILPVPRHENFWT